MSYRLFVSIEFGLGVFCLMMGITAPDRTPFWLSLMPLGAYMIGDAVGTVTTLISIKRPKERNDSHA